MRVGISTTTCPFLHTGRRQGEGDSAIFVIGNLLTFFGDLWAPQKCNNGMCCVALDQTTVANI